MAAAKGRTEILVDGGIRRGADVVKALALGAKAVFIGRPLFWGLALGGEQGVIARIRHTSRRNRDHHGQVRQTYRCEYPFHCGGQSAAALEDCESKKLRNSAPCD